jgi:ParB/RepB/Spo0J family partition protein
MKPDRVERVLISEIKVGDRQRSDLDTAHSRGIGSLEDSIRTRGLINPITIDQDYNLIAGGRRLAACKKLGHPSILCRFIEDLDLIERQIIELEENVKRSDLSWRDQVRAVKRLHDLHCEERETWTQRDTADAVGLAYGTVSQILRVAEDLDHPRIEHANSCEQAYNGLKLIDQRRHETVLSSVRDAARHVMTRLHMVASADGTTHLKEMDPLPTRAEPPPSLLNANFLEWAPAYSGPRFNFIHCDFPYGIEFNKGPQGGRDKDARYSDTADVYWTLLECLCTNLDHLMATSAHLMFWFSMEHYTETLAYFAARAPSLQFLRQPLVWTKSDNVGILADPRRRPRNTYETCLMAAREDRPIVKSVANWYSAPTDKRYHPSTKPEPMLRHFMQMFVDGTTRLLDPTCGSGAALRAAESLDAHQVLGLELDLEYYESALIALKSFRTMRQFHSQHRSPP